MNPSKKQKQDAEWKPNELYYKVLELFPNVDRQFLQKLCMGCQNSLEELDLVINLLLSNPNYPTMAVEPEVTPIPIDFPEPENQLEFVRQILPDADPNYLLSELSQLTTQDELRVFISGALERRDYPTYENYLRKQQINAQTKQYTSEFNVVNFVKLFPDPESYFNNDEKIKKFVKYSMEQQDYILRFLKNRYTKITAKQIQIIVKKSPNVLTACLALDKCRIGKLKTERRTVYAMDDMADIPLLQMLAFIQHREKILKCAAEKKVAEEKHREEVKKHGLMVTCSCCFDNEVIPEDAIRCQNDCISCKSCVEKYIEVSFGEGKLNYFCLTDCGAEYGLQLIQQAVDPKLFSIIAQKKQVEEVISAGIEGLESCPFCDFATIPAPNDKLFRCLNFECMKESCRLCKEPSHVPLRCEEVEKDDDVKNRVYIENKMAEALIRKCYRCGLKYIKADGCNKIKCSCGAMMCYICNKPVENYQHFNGQGGDRFDLCPLFSDTNLLHKNLVMQSMNAAKAELGEKHLVIDPTVDVAKYYEEQMQKNPSVVPHAPRHFCGDCGVFH